MQNLSPRQLEVAYLLDEGLTYIEIGERLGISPTTARQHVRDMRLKFGVTHKRHLPHILRELGLIPPRNK